MIIEKTVAKKSLAVTLALALFASAPVNAWSQVQAAAARAVPGSGAGMLGAIGTIGQPAVSVMSTISLPNLSLNSPALAPSVSPAVAALTVAPAVAAQPLAPAAQPLALEAHPVIGVLNALQAKGVQLPETLTTREDAAKLIVAAQAMPEGTAKQNMIAMAAAINAANNTGSSAQLGRIFDAEQARAEAPEAAPVQAGGWRSAVARLLPSSLSKMVAKKAPEVAPVVAQAADPRNFAVKLEDLRYAPAAAQLPENTSKVPMSDKQVVGQDAGLKAIKFGLQMPGRHYNLFVAGPDGSGRETALRHMLPEVAGKMPTPGDRVAVTNFQDKENPLVLNLEKGRGPAFVKGVSRFVATLKAVLPEQLESGPIGAAKKQVVAQIQEAAERREEAFKAEVAAITLAGGVFTVEFFANPSGEGRMMIGLKLMRNGQAVDPASVDADIASGAYTRAQFDAANKERDQKFPAVMEKFKAMMELNNKEMEAAQEKIGQLESQAVAAVVSQVAQPLMGLVMPETKATPEMAALQEKIEAWSADFEARVSAVDVEGFGVAFIQNGNRLMVAYTKGGEALDQAKVAELMAQGLTPAKFKQIQEQLTAAVEPLLAEFKAKNQEFGKAQQELAKNQPKAEPTPEQLKAASYVKMLTQFSVANHRIFMGKIGSTSDADGVKDAPGQKPMDAEDFFEASVLSSNGGKTGAPVVWVKNPTLDKVFGKADDNRRTMIIPGVGLVKGGAPGGPTLIGGAIQQAEGGFLVMDFMDVLRAPGLYQALMAAAKTGEASMVEGGLQSLLNGRNEAYHVPSKVKIVLIGSPSLRMMVARQDSDFALNFQASADFESSLKVSEESVAGYVQFFKKAVVSLAQELKQEVTNLTQDAMSALVEQGARMADSNKKLTAQFGALYGVVREATYWAREAGRNEVRREDVDTALQAKQDREEVYRRHLLQVYKDNVFVVETEGKKVGQINGLAVMGTFGVPMRITVVPSAAAGAGGIISVDRQAGPNQTGSSFNKALGVVEGFLQNLFAQKRPFPARLSISYEQNYGGIDGDSATSTEIYSILSALSGVGIGQNFAVTGSADQFGNVQAIGGANHKIEGFYELAKARGLTGTQGILIPQANVADLQLSPEVVEAVKAGKFHIYAVSHVSEGLEILTGVAYSEILAKARANLAQMGKPEAKKN